MENTFIPVANGEERPRQDGILTDSYAGEKKEHAPQGDLYPLRPVAYDQARETASLSLYKLWTEAVPERMEVPAEVFGLTGLRSLNLGCNPWRELPDALGKLTELEELRLDLALTYIEKLPDLTSLKKLRRLSFGGQAHAGATQAPDVALLTAVIEMAAAMPNLEVLELNDWGKAFDAGRKLRGEPDPSVIKGLGKLKQLRILSLANCGLHELPEELYSLTGLDYLDLRQNILTVQTVDRLMKELKNTSSDIDISCYYDTPPELMEFRHLLGNAATCYAALKNKETAPEEKPVYRKNLHYCMQKAAERITAGVPRSVYDEIMYYQYSALKSEEFLSTQPFSHEECLSAIEALKEVESRLALHYENTHRGILANLSWASVDLPDTVCAVILEKCSDRELLDAAARRMQAALAHKTGYYRFGAASRTWVDLLVKAGRQKEAFEIVAAQPKNAYLQDFANHTVYQTWLQSRND